MDVVLYRPRIPSNTGNIIRICSNTGLQLRLIEPLGFDLDDRRMKRAGLDYHEYVNIRCHSSLEDFHQTCSPGRVVVCSTKGAVFYSGVSYSPSDTLLFGSETSGLPDKVFASTPPEHIVRIPMRTHSRSLNLSNSVAVIVYEALRQQHFMELK